MCKRTKLINNNIRYHRLVWLYGLDGEWMYDWMNGRSRMTIYVIFNLSNCLVWVVVLSLAFFFMFLNIQFSNTKTKWNMSQHYFILTKLIKNCLWMRAICDVIWLQNEANWICYNSIRFIEFAVIRGLVGCLCSTPERHLEGISMSTHELSLSEL